MRREYRTGRTASARSLSPYAQLDLDTAGRPYNDAMRSGGLRVKRFILLAAALLCHALLTFSAARAGSQIPALPEGARTRWIVKDTQEIVAYVTFDPARLEADRPRALRFITVDELASGGVSWATDYLKGNPTHGRWGVSFVEILRAGTFAIDGRAPNWPAHGAVALWCRAASHHLTRQPTSAQGAHCWSSDSGCPTAPTWPTCVARGTRPHTPTSRSRPTAPVDGRDRSTPKA